MGKQHDIRWEQRFSNYLKAFNKFEEAVNYFKQYEELEERLENTVAHVTSQLKLII